MTHRLRFALTAGCLAFGLAACGDDSDSSTNDVATSPVSASDPASPDATAGDTVAAPPGGKVDILLAARSLGDILTDEAGFTLYLFTADSENTVTCTGSCAETWPGFLSGDSLFVGPYLDEDLVGVATGADGNEQLTYNGHPLYHYSGDASPGDVNGQGVGGTWFAVDADGNAVD